MGISRNEIPADLAEAIEFHGHLCPGLVMGYLAARTALERLHTGRAEDEELIAIVENDTCAVDAVQFLTGCTFGKGNLFFRDYGKMVFTFALRPSGRAVRFSLKRRADSQGEDAPQDPQERRDLQIQSMLQQPVDDLFSIRQETIALPDAARIHESVTCQNCNETVMETRAQRISGLLLCIPCAIAKDAEK